MLPTGHEFHDLRQSPEKIAELFARLGLAGKEEIPRVELLTGGVSSNVFRVELGSGIYCLKQALPKLKVSKDWRAPVERVFAEIDWLEAAGKIVPANVPKIMGHDEATKSFVMEFLGGEYQNWKAELLAGRVDPVLAGKVGNVLGRIHAETAATPELRRTMANDDNFYSLRLEPYLVETARVHPGLADKLHGLVERTRNTKLAMVHGDVSPKNIMTGPAGPVLLDAECALVGDPAFDLAFCLNHFLLKAVLMPESSGLLMKSYDALIKEYIPQITFESKSGLESRTASLLPALTLARVDGKSPVEYLDGARQEKVRQAALKLLNSTDLNFQTIKHFWTRHFK